MRLPRDLGGVELVKRLERVGYAVSRQTGSRIRLTCISPQGHHLTRHDPLRFGTLASILADVAAAQGISRDELTARLFD